MKKFLATLLAALTIAACLGFGASALGEPKIGQPAYDAVQWTWGAAQNTLGGIVYLALSASNPTGEFYGAKVVEVPTSGFGGLTLGKYIMVGKGSLNSTNLLTHEYGHTVQSLYLGPLYLVVIGLPSLTWAQFGGDYRRANGVGYYSFYTESWANDLAREWLPAMNAESETTGKINLEGLSEEDLMKVKLALEAIAANS